MAAIYLSNNSFSIFFFFYLRSKFRIIWGQFNLRTKYLLLKFFHCWLYKNTSDKHFNQFDMNFLFLTSRSFFFELLSLMMSMFIVQHKILFSSVYQIDKNWLSNDTTVEKRFRFPFLSYWVRMKPTLLSYFAFLVYDFQTFFRNIYLKESFMSKILRFFFFFVTRKLLGLK